MDLETLASLSEQNEHQNGGGYQEPPSAAESMSAQSVAIVESDETVADGVADGTNGDVAAAADDGLVVEATIEMAPGAADETASADAAGDGAPAQTSDLDAILGDAADTEAGTEVEGLDAIVESLLLASGGPVPLARLVEALDGPSRKEVTAALAVLGARYERDNRGLRLTEVAGAFQLRTAPQHGPFVRRLLGGKPPRLSRPMLETLAIVAYRQPCTRPEIEAIRGVDCDAVLSTLLERRLVRMLGRKEAPGRPVLYGTTRDFLEVFGLPDLRALPPLRDLGDGIELLMGQDLQIGPNGVRPTEPVSEVAPPEAADDASAPETAHVDQPAAVVFDEERASQVDEPVLADIEGLAADETGEVEVGVVPAQDVPIRDALVLAETHDEADEHDQDDDESDAEAERYGD